jgi:hypothetical protein
VLGFSGAARLIPENCPHRQLPRRLFGALVVPSVSSEEVESRRGDDSGLQRPDGDGWMPLFDLVWWVASEGHQIELAYSVHNSSGQSRADVSKQLENSPPSKRWDQVELKIVEALDKNLLSLSGLKGGRGLNQRIPSEQLSKLSTDRRWEEKWLVCIPTPDRSDQYQYQIFGQGMREPSWTNIMASKEDARRLWPFSLPGQATLTKRWKTKGEKLTPTEIAILDAVNNLWPNGHLDHHGGSRLQRINDYLKANNTKVVSLRTVQRTQEKIHFG